MLQCILKGSAMCTTRSPVVRSMCRFFPIVPFAIAAVISWVLFPLATYAQTVTAWGYNIHGQATVPDDGLTDVTAISAGASHNLALVVIPPNLQFGCPHGGPGDVVSVEVSLDLNIKLGIGDAGLQFDLTAQGAVFQGAVAVNLQPNIQITTRILEPGVSRAQMTGLPGHNGEGDAKGHSALMNLVYQLEDSLNYGDRINLDVSNSVLYNSASESIGHNVQNGYIAVGVRGDLAGNDGVVDITDLTALIRLILQIDPDPAPASFGFFQADIDGDGDISILHRTTSVCNLIAVLTTCFLQYEKGFHS